MTPSRRKGMRTGMVVVPTFVAIFIGFGVASQVADIPVPAALAMTLFVFAAPAQFAMIDLAGQGASALQVIYVGVLVNLRFLLMSLTLAHMFPRTPRQRLLPWAQFIAASPYLLTFFETRKQRGTNAFGFFQGIVLLVVPAAIAGTALGLVLGAGLSPVLAFGATLFLPIYFALLLAAEDTGKPELAAIVLGLVLTPPLELLVPGWGMLIAALTIGITITVAIR